jgi:hypothetical protein
VPHVALITTAHPLPAVAVAGLPSGALVLRHRARPDGPAWTGLVAVPLGAEAGADAVLDLVDALGVRPERAALGRVQPGLDLWAPGSARGPAVHVTEYITSDPTHREAYYGSQGAVSGPAMRDLWHGGLVQRFVGVEVLHDVVPGRGDDTPWDLLHVTSFSLAALPRMLGWRRLFDRHAQAAGYPDMRSLSARWAGQRTMHQVRSRLLRGPGRA